MPELNRANLREYEAEVRDYHERLAAGRANTQTAGSEITGVLISL